jgi:hypothetical protein
MSLLKRPWLATIGYQIMENSASLIASPHEQVVSRRKVRAVGCLVAHELGERFAQRTPQHHLTLTRYVTLVSL